LFLAKSFIRKTNSFKKSNRQNPNTSEKKVLFAFADKNEEMSFSTRYNEQMTWGEEF